MHVLLLQHALLQTLKRTASVVACGSLRPAQLMTPEAYAAAKRTAVAERFPSSLGVEDFLASGGVGCNAAPPSLPILDVRSPCEFAKGHIPGATSFPLFTDEERAEVGTLYKTKGHDVAVERGLEIVDGSWREMLGRLPDGLQPDDDVLVYCKRGGMRSSSVAWLLGKASLRARTLSGGYQAFRHWILDGWESERRLVVLAGRTGSGKTDVLHALRDGCAAQVLDLEGDANHRGSSFGSLGRPAQPSSEMYENVLGLQWNRFVPGHPVFIEDEGAHVGSCGVPAGLWRRMRAADSEVLRMEVPDSVRIERLVREYGAYPVDALIKCTRTLQKRLGDEQADAIVALLEREPPDLAKVAQLLLIHYYDGTYLKKAQQRPGHVRIFECDTSDAAAAAARVLSELAELGAEAA